jgi:hypothetical protein
MKLFSRIALLFVVVPLLILLVRGELFSPSPLVILAQVVALAVLVWARTIFRVLIGSGASRTVSRRGEAPGG